MIAGIRTYRNILIKILFTYERQPINERRQITWHPCDKSNVSDFPQRVFKATQLRNLLKFLIKRSFINWQMHMRSIYWQAMPKVKKKNDKQRQRLDKVRKRDDRATNEKAVSKTCVEKLSIRSVDVHVANNQIILMGQRTCGIGVNYRVEILQPLIPRTCLQRHRQLLINI